MQARLLRLGELIEQSGLHDVGAGSLDGVTECEVQLSSDAVGG
jgi:hypothetical protein